MITKKDLLKDLQVVKEKINQIPSKNLYKKYGKYSTETFHRRFGSWNKALKECFDEIVKEKPQKRNIIKCIQCGEKTKNPKFCSQSCSAIYNNIQRSNPNTCIKCGCKIRKQSICCKNCIDIYRTEKYGEKTIKEFRDIPASKNRYQSVRNHAHQIANIHNLNKTCPYCNYTNHAQLCHIKDIGDFPDSATLTEINHPTNLIFLCPNHHWDLDHNLLTL